MSTTTYEFQTTDGSRLNRVENFQSDTLDIDQMAIVEAKSRLEEDPELGEVLVFKDDCYIGRATHVPDADWQSVVAWLWDGEQVLPPAGIPPEHDGSGYDISDPKHPRHHDVFSGLSDDR